MTEHERQCRMLGCWLLFSRVPGAGPSEQSKAHAVCRLHIVDTQSTLSSTSTAEVRAVHPEDYTLDLKIQRGFNFQRQTAGAMMEAKSSDTAKV